MRHALSLPEGYGTEAIKKLVFVFSVVL